MKSFLVFALIMVITVNSYWHATSGEAMGTAYGAMHERFDDAARLCLSQPQCSCIVYVKNFGYTLRRNTVPLHMRPGDTTYNWVGTIGYKITPDMLRLPVNNVDDS